MSMGRSIRSSYHAYTSHSGNLAW